MRVDEAVKRLGDKLDIGVVTKKENIFYLTGFFPTAFAVLVLGDSIHLAVSAMDAELTKDVDIEVRVVKSFKKDLNLKGRVGIEKKHSTVSFVEEFLKGCKLYNIDFIDKMRQIKDRSELNLLKKAIKVSREVLENIDLFGRTEKEVAAQIGYKISQIAEVAFDPIIAAGMNSAIPHHAPTDKVIKEQDQVIVDFGSRVDHYNCDVTRTFLKNPNAKFKDIYHAVRQAQREAIKKLKGGTKAVECDATVRSVLGEYGYEKYFIHSTGHGVGLDVHEPPRISNESNDTLKNGMVVTIEPGIYIPGWGGVRKEDMVLVGKKPEVLTNYP
jgi:Xaa-Pro aminopeptidase